MTPIMLENRTFDEIGPGDSATLARVLGRDDVELFAATLGDIGAAHPDTALVAAARSGHAIAHAMWMGALISALLGTRLPGPGTLCLAQEQRFHRPVAPGDTVTATVRVLEKRPETRILLLNTSCTNQAGEEVLSGSATVIAPDRKIACPGTAPPGVVSQRHAPHDHFLREALSKPALTVAVVHPCSAAAILAAKEARDAGLAEPLLIGPEHKIRAAAEDAKIDLAGFRIEPAPHSHAAAARAVAMAAAGEAGALMKGSLHSDELLAAVIAPDSGLRTERRISHVYAMDIPAYPKPLLITDAAVNIAPTLDQKRDICQNAVDLLHLLGVAEPLVAVLAAVETVNPAMPATLDAAALTVMAARGQITGARVDGPLAFDNAVSLDAARTKGIVSPVAGQADILLVPDLEAGNMLAKQLLYFAGAAAAGLVLGARVPIVLTSRADPLRVRLASLALARLIAARQVAP